MYTYIQANMKTQDFQNACGYEKSHWHPMTVSYGQADETQSLLVYHLDVSDGGGVVYDGQVDRRLEESERCVFQFAHVDRQLFTFKECAETKRALKKNLKLLRKLHIFDYGRNERRVEAIKLPPTLES